MNDGRPITFDSSRVVRVALGVLVALGTVWLFARGLSRSNATLLFMPLALFALVVLLNYPAITCVLFIGLFSGQQAFVLPLKYTNSTYLSTE